MDTAFPPKTLSIPTNLPALMTTTIGREREIAALANLLRQPETHLVTLTGPGGVGKTRLGLETARELHADFANGVFFVSLAPLREQGQVLLAIAQAVGIKETSGQAVTQRLHAYLREKRCLLLLDNWEHLLPFAHLAADLLANAPHLTILATSREMLHLYGEREIVVPPLALPELTIPEPGDESAAMTLFIERARAARPTFVLDDENRRVVAEICVQLDGLPLAIELAASRCKLLSPQMILARLSSRLNLLTGGARNLPARQQTLRNTLDWSYDLLNETEQHCFRRLGVFIGSWTFEAAEAVAAPEHLDLLYLLTSLVDKSLVRVVEETPTETRFLLLETIREYALECLTDQHEDEETRQRHADFYLNLAEEVEPQLQGEGQQAGLQRLDRESVNLRAALRWSIERGEVRRALRLASALRDYLLLRDSQSTGSQWFEEVLAMPGAQEASFPRARVLYAAGALARIHSDLELASTRLNESREVARQVNDRHTLALALGMLAQLELYPGNYNAARALAEEGLRATESTPLRFGTQNVEQGVRQSGTQENVNDRWGRGILHRIYGNIASQQGDFNAASTRYSVSLMLLREAGDRRNEAETMVSLGGVMRLRGKLRSAHYLYAKGSQLFRELRDRWGQLTCLNGMGEALRMQGDYPQARACFEEALALAALLGDRTEQAAALLGLGQLALRQDQRTEAARHLKKALHLAREVNHTQGLVMALCRLGDLERSQQRWSSATSYYQQGLELVRGSGDKLLLILLLVGQGEAARAQGKYVLACAHIKQSLHLAWEVGNHAALATGLEALAWLCVQADQPEHGALLLGAAHELRETLQTPLAPVYQDTYARDLAALKTAIGQDAFAECWAGGRALPLPQVMALAVAQVHISETSSHPREKVPGAPYNLTARELDVLRLLAEGHADARIAKLLVVSPRTVNTHLRSIYAKLGVSSRSAATRVALEQKLV